MDKIAMISAILEEPEKTQEQFNKIVGEYKGIIKGRMGIPFENENVAAISLTVVADVDKINSFTGKLGKIPNASIKTAISKKEI